MMLITTDKHPELKIGIVVHEATNPEGMYIAMANYVMCADGKLYYETNILQKHIEKGFIKIIQ